MKRLLINLALVAIIFALVAVFFLYKVLKPQSSSSTVVEFEVSKGQNLNAISKLLVEKGLLKYPSYFKNLAVLMGRDSNLRAGSYTIPHNVSVYWLVKILSESNGEFKVTVTIPEGFTMKGINERLSKLVGRSVDISRFKIKDFSSGFDVLNQAPPNASLEGYVYPDTYDIDRYDSDAEFVQRFLTNFDKKLTPDARAAVVSQKKSLNEILTMASLIEKEIPVDHDGERRIVSGVLWKRLEAGMPLQVDATIVYITGRIGQKVLLSDLKIDSPYNTYLNPGLPPGPISNPGINAIKAALSPEKSPYWYYLSKPSGETVFSKTLEEHNAARAKFLQ